MNIKAGSARFHIRNTLPIIISFTSEAVGFAQFPIWQKAGSARSYIRNTLPIIISFAFEVVGFAQFLM